MFTTMDNFLQMLPIKHRMREVPYVLFKGPGGQKRKRTHNMEGRGEILVVKGAENKNIGRRNRMEPVELK